MQRNAFSLVEPKRSGVPAKVGIQLQRAFSLVELSIVLVILGLLTGGILGGQSLIRAAELRAVNTEYARYSTAINTFRDKYFAYPGDFRDGTRFWGRQIADGTCASNAGIATASTPGVCDGNGDGILNNAAASTPSETFQSWRQLALAGLIEGNYTGITGALNSASGRAGEQYPKSRIGNGAWYLWYWGTTGSNSAESYQGINYGTALFIGATTGDNWPNARLLKPEEAWNLDTKFDDGKPARGRVIAQFFSTCAVADDGNTVNTNLAASYALNDSSIRCNLFFTNAF